MNRVIASRGPDDEGYFHDRVAGVGLAHRRLAIIDVSPAGHQPMWDATETVVLIFNGEIYNYQELFSQLRSDGFRFKSTCDTEVILNLYLRDGVNFVKSLVGMFAIALWDPRANQILLARDAFGVKPLYYSNSRAGFAFASEIKALIQLPDLDRRLDIVALSQYLTYLYCPAPGTALASVKKVLPGEALVISAGKVVKQWRFYSPPLEVIGPLSVGDAKRELIVCLDRAVRSQMMSDVPVGAFLSGGLDSSAVVAFARNYAGDRPLECFTIGFEGEGHSDFADDLPYAKRVAAHLGVKLNTVWVRPRTDLNLEEMLWHLDEPLADPASINVLSICKVARQAGIKVLLSGAGGDDVFTGYRRHFALTQERYWGWLPSSARALLRRVSSWPSKRSPMARRIAKVFEFADQDSNRRIAGYFSWLPRRYVYPLFSEQAQIALLGRDPLQPMLDEMKALPRTVPRLNRMLHLERQYFLADHNLNYTDKMSMAAGVEVRVPFLDPDLVRFAARLPMSYKQHGAVGKWIFKLAMEGYLPPDTIYRPKTGFGVPLRAWLQGSLRAYSHEILAESEVRRLGVFDFESIQRLLRMNDSGQVDAAYPILQLMCIHIWARLFRATA